MRLSLLWVNLLMQFILEFLHGALLVLGHHNPLPKLVKNKILLCCRVVPNFLQLPPNNLVLEVLHDPRSGRGGVHQDQPQAARGVEHTKPKVED